MRHTSPETVRLTAATLRQLADVLERTTSLSAAPGYIPIGPGLIAGFDRLESVFTIVEACSEAIAAAHAAPDRVRAAATIRLQDALAEPVTRSAIERYRQLGETTPELHDKAEAMRRRSCEREAEVLSDCPGIVEAFRHVAEGREKVTGTERIDGPWGYVQRPPPDRRAGILMPPPRGASAPCRGAPRGGSRRG